VPASGEQCLKVYLGLLMPAEADLDIAAEDLLRWATVHWRLRMPSLLVDEALGSLPTVTLSTRDYYRVVGRPAEWAKRVSDGMQKPQSVKLARRKQDWQAVQVWKAAFERSWPREIASFNAATQF
jgi:hypothetical protein